jgi:mono/diheme cytochrome c family protein
VRALAALVVVLVLLAAAALAYVRATGLDARGQPAEWEASLARRVRSFAVPDAERSRSNSVADTAAAVTSGLEHYADHCASCHAADGSGNTAIGRGLWPKAPDMRAAATQGLSDGELFYVIEHGVRFTGMPAWSTGDAAGEESSWQLVHFIRQLPHLTTEQRARIQALMPRSPEEIRQEIAEEQFLQGR